jgi:leucine dehydrogenase
MFDSLASARLQDLHLFNDQASGLNAIIAIHSTSLGPALGGCRCLPYESSDAAIRDAMALARGMSYKAALAGLPQGGGKAVIMLPPGQVDRRALFRAFGDCVEQLAGRYITAMDSGTELQDLDEVASRTSYVVGTGQDGFDPSPMTARGVLAAIRSGANHCLDRDKLDGLHVAIQGLGHVGSNLAAMLDEAGARLTVTDTDPDRCAAAASQFDATVVDCEAIYQTDCDVFSPCALGQVLDPDSIASLRCKVIAGAANNQLADGSCGERLRQRGIFYAPDYLVNAGGLIRLVLSRAGQVDQVEARVDGIGDVLAEVIRLSRQDQLPSNEVADRLAEERLYG